MLSIAKSYRIGLLHHGTLLQYLNNHLIGTLTLIPKGSAKGALWVDFQPVSVQLISRQDLK